MSNWQQEKDMFSPHDLLDSFQRDPEGRKTRWTARVFLHESTWHGRLERRSGRFAIMHLNPDGAWDFTPFNTPEEAMRHIDEYVKLRRDPNTWRGSGSQLAQQRLVDLENNCADCQTTQPPAEATEATEEAEAAEAAVDTEAQPSTGKTNGFKSEISPLAAIYSLEDAVNNAETLDQICNLLVSIEDAIPLLNRAQKSCREKLRSARNAIGQADDKYADV